MLIKKILIASLLLSSVSVCAQPFKRADKKTNHIVGIQANQLIRQIFNFSNNNPSINNPYLLTYSVTNTKTGWGLDAGLGYTYNNIFENDGNTKKETFINDANVRIGVQKNIMLTQRFSTQFSIHGILDFAKNKTVAQNDFQGQLSRTTSKSDVLRYGGGPALAIRYALNNRISVGTECNYYLKFGTNKINVTTYSEFQGQQTFFNETKSDNDLTTLIFNAPAAIFLQVKL